MVTLHYLPHNNTFAKSQDATMGKLTAHLYVPLINWPMCNRKHLILGKHNTGHVTEPCGIPQNQILSLSPMLIHQLSFGFIIVILAMACPARDCSIKALASSIYSTALLWTRLASPSEPAVTTIDMMLKWIKLAPCLRLCQWQWQRVEIYGRDEWVHKVRCEQLKLLSIQVVLKLHVIN